THFTAQHLVFGLGIAAEVDAVDVGTLARVDEEGDGDGVVLVVRFRHAVDVGEGITLVTQATGDQFAGGGHDLAREDLPFLDQQQRTHVLFRNLEITGQFHVADAVLLALFDVDGDVDVLLVRGDGYLGRADIHVDVAAVQVIGTQTLQVTGQLLAGVLVVVLEEGQPVGGLQLEQVHQVFIGEYGVADHVDVGNGCHGTFVDGDLQRHAVTRLRNHFGLDLGRIAALGNVLALQLVTHTFEGGALEDLAFGQTGLIQALEQIFGGDGLVAFDLDTGDGRTLDHGDDQHVAIATKLDVLEEAGAEQGAGGIDQLAIIHLLAHVERQRAKHAARRHPLQAIDAYIGDGEGLSVNFGDHQCGQYRR